MLKKPIRRGPKPKPAGEKKVILTVSVKAKHAEKVRPILTQINEQYGSWNS